MLARFSRIAGLIVACVLLLAACSGDGDGGVASPPVTQPPAVQTPPTGPTLPSTPLVQDPRDARGVAVCDLLRPSQLAQLGLESSSAREVTMVATAPSCAWRRSDDGAKSGGVQVRTDLTVTAIDGLTIAKDTFVRFEPTVVSNHPAVRADDSARTGCTIYTAIADYQAIATNGDNSGSDPDPCARSRRMAEMILSNLPPLR
jgi:hypothetical protein